MKEYILVDENNVITEHSCFDGTIDIPDGSRLIEVKDWYGYVGTSIDNYDENWNYIVQEPIEEEIQPIQSKIEEQPQVTKSLVEQIKDGEAELPLGMKIVDDELVSMSLEEIIESNLPNYFKADVLKSYLTMTDYVVIKIAEGEATKEEYADVLAKRKEYRKMINELEETK